MSAFVIITVIIGLIALAVYNIYKNHKKGGCGCGCKNCAYKEACQSHKA
ncbi:MAG: FeoB-associated Cys-rich membrane protein [Clostridia bacterium]|jgi:hypothetical protein|nr:FeoB-associated Cys-rich membrane protein [Clostridia bacterium]